MCLPEYSSQRDCQRPTRMIIRLINAAMVNCIPGRSRLSEYPMLKDIEIAKVWAVNMADV